LWFAFVALFSLILAGCVQEHIETPGGQSGFQKIEITSAQKMRKMLEAEAKCGVFRFRPPFFNVTGVLSTAVRPNSSIFLYAPQDTSYGRIMEIAHGCRPLVRFPISGDGIFTFSRLPAGNYAAVIPANRFEPGRQGFPVINEYDQNSYQVRMAWHGGDNRYSIASFTIESTPTP